MTWHPKSKDIETFDPYISSTVDIMELKNIFINGEKITDIDRLVKVIEFNDVNQDGFSSGKGKVNKILINDK